MPARSIENRSRPAETHSLSPALRQHPESEQPRVQQGRSTDYLRPMFSQVHVAIVRWRNKEANDAKPLRSPCRQAPDGTSRNACAASGLPALVAAIRCTRPGWLFGLHIPTPLLDLAGVQRTRRSRIATMPSCSRSACLTLTPRFRQRRPRSPCGSFADSGRKNRGVGPCTATARCRAWARTRRGSCRRCR